MFVIRKPGEKNEKIKWWGISRNGMPRGSSKYTTKKFRVSVYIMFFVFSIKRVNSAKTKKIVVNCQML
jgi:hypothetical protein